MYLSVNVQRTMQRMTAGAKLLVLCKDRSTQWFSLKDLKKSNPGECAEYTKARKIDNKPAFRRWVSYTLKKKDRIIIMIKSRIKANLHKYGIEFPGDQAHTEKLDTKIGNRFWQDAHDKEMFNVSVTFYIFYSGEQAPVGWTKPSGHLIWDLKMDFTGKQDGRKMVIVLQIQSDQIMPEFLLKILFGLL